MQISVAAALLLPPEARTKTLSQGNAATRSPFRAAAASAAFRTL
jgi:hypothetical protein